ncbi:MAG: CvpA family protein [Anaerolineales bacterium]|nr:CvpA family protein [Anaerolineales bacterium]
MYNIQKLKPDRNFYWLLLPVGSYLGAAFFGLLYGWNGFFYFFTCFFGGFAAYSLLTVTRTHNLYFIIQAGYMLALAFATWFAPEAIARRSETPSVMLFLGILVIFMLVWLIIVFINRKLKWRGRDVLELAAANIEETGNGYTPRPMPAGKTDFTQHQILAFAEFARRNLIAVPYVGKERTIFVPVRAGFESPFILGLKSDYTDETWVAFDYEGNVSVNIAHRDYLDFRESLAFDQLCAGLGNLFVEFVDMYNRKEGLRIVDRLNAVGVSVFS